MNALVGYGSSDEEDDIQPEKPAKVGSCYTYGTEKLWMPTNVRDCQIAKTAANTPSSTTQTTSGSYSPIAWIRKETDPIKLRQKLHQNQMRLHHSQKCH